MIYELVVNCNKFFVSLHFPSFFLSRSHGGRFYLFARKINDLTLDLANEKRQSVFVAVWILRKRKTVTFHTHRAVTCSVHIHHAAESALGV